MESLEDEVGEEENCRQSQQQHRGGQPGVLPEAIHETKISSNVPPEVLYKEMVPVHVPIPN